MDSPYDRLARERFGLPHLYPYQRLLIDEIVRAIRGEAARHGLVILPTGAGKSLIYMLPTLCTEALSLIIYPLNALINDQKRRFDEAGIAAAALTGGISPGTRRSILDAAAAGKTRALLINPETLLLPEVARRLREMELGHVVFDEAHTLIEWGESFRPAYLEAVELMHTLPYRRLSGFTATATPELLTRIGRRLFCGEQYELYRKSPARDNIAFKLFPSLSPEADLVNLLERGEIELPGIIFCATRKETESSAALIRSLPNPPPVDYYHAGLSREEKLQIEKRFMAGGERLLTATCAFGLGVDCPGVRTVLHLAPPPSVEAYVQESGRAGRDGLSARAILLLSPVQREEAGREARRSAFVEGYLSASDCRRSALLRQFASEAKELPEAAESCGICDLCRAEKVSLPLGGREIIESISRFPGCFNRRGLTEFLKGYAGPGVRFIEAEYSPLFGSLAAWRYEWIEDAIEALLRFAFIRSGRFLGSQRLRLARRGRALLLYGPWK